MSVYTGRRWVDPLNKKIGRRTGKDVRAGKNIRVDKYGFENFDDYFSESDAELTRDFSRHQAIKEESESAGTQDSEDEHKENQSSQSNTVSQIMPNSVVSNTTCNNFQSSQSLSQYGASNTSKFGWLRNRNIGRRTGKNLRANKQIRLDENGFENFDDYLSESDMSSLSSRLSVSSVRPYRRQDTINSSYKEDAAESLNSKTLQRTVITDESQSSESSQEDKANSQPELREERDITNSVQTSHYEGSSGDEKTFTRKNHQDSTQSHSYRSLSEHDDPTGEVEEEDLEEERGDNNTKQMSGNGTFQPSYVDTPVSSKSSRSYSKVVKDGYSNSEIVNNKTQNRSTSKNDSSRHDKTNHSSDDITQEKGRMSMSELGTTVEDVTNDGYNDISQRKHVERTTVNESLQNKQSKSIESTVTDSNYDSTKWKSRISIAIDESNHGNQSKTFEKTNASYNGDEDVDSEGDEYDEEHEVEPECDSAEEDVETESDDKHADTDLPEESDNTDHSEDESDEDIYEKDNITEAKVDKNGSNLSKHVEKEHSGKKSDIKSVTRNEQEVHMTNKSTYASEKDCDYDEDSDDHYDDDDLRPSQAPSNIDVAGNKSGSITKLDIPASVVSFNKTRKRLSYSAGEASEKTIKRNKSRMEEANAELFEVNVSKTSSTSKVELSALPNGNAEKLDKVNDKKSESKKDAVDVRNEDNSDFVSLTSRSTFAHTTETISVVCNDEDDDIEILDYDKSRNKSRVGRKLSTKDRTRKQPHKSDLESHSDSGKQTELKQLNKVSKTDVKVKKTKDGNKIRRKSAHDFKITSDIDSNSKSKRQKSKSKTDMTENLDYDNNNAVKSYTDTNSSSENDAKKDIRSKTHGNLKRKKVLNETNKTAVENNSSITRNNKVKERKSQQVTHTSADDVDSKISDLYAENENESESGNDSVIHNHRSKSRAKEKLPENAGNSKFKKGNSAKNPKLKRKANAIYNDVEFSDGKENDSLDADNIDEVSPAQSIKVSSKKVRKNMISQREHENFNEQTKGELMRKSFSEDGVEGMNTKNTQKSKSGRKSRKAKENVSDDNDMYPDEELLENIGHNDLKVGKAAKNPRIKANVIPDDDVELSDNDDNDFLETDNIDEVSPAQNIKSSTKKVKIIREYENLREESKKGSKRKSSSEDDVETKMNAKKSKKTESVRNSRKAKKNVSIENDVYQDEEVLENTGNSDFKKGKAAKNQKLKRKAKAIPDDLELSDNNDENDCLDAGNIDEASPVQNIKMSNKKATNDLIRENENLKVQSKKGSNRKSSSEDDVETKMNTKKTKKSKSVKKSRKAKKGVSDDIDLYQNEEADTGNEVQLDDSKDRTPKPDSRLSMPTNFGSGVSFRVSRRSELLEDVRSGYIGEVNVEMEPTGGLTPCISRPGAVRKSKGRRVTICPEENIEHNVSSGMPSINASPLPHFDTTPVHICETTNSTTPCPDHDQSVIEDRLIKPSPPEEGLRRSQRTRLKPIAWYKNEQVVFDYRRRSGPAIIGVKPSLEVKWNKLEEEKRRRKKLKYQIRKASQQGKDKPYRKLSIHTEIPTDIELADNSDPEITIYNHNLETEDGIECIGKREAFKPVGPSHKTPKREDPYLITKQLNHPCMSAGKLTIKPNAEKPEQLVTADYVVFYIEHGKVLVTIHKTTTLLESGDTFMVPIGNTYRINNLRNDTAKLFYTLHKPLDNSEQSIDQ